VALGFFMRFLIFCFGARPYQAPCGSPAISSGFSPDLAHVAQLVPFLLAKVERGDAGGVLDERNHCELFALHRLDLLPRLDALRAVRRINLLGDDALAIQLAGRLEQRLPVAFMVLTV
jgi:hypothetical protein